MRVCYVLLSPSFGMHQYTADLANRMAQADYDTHLVTTMRVPRDRYVPTVNIHGTLDIGDTGLSGASLRLGYLKSLRREIAELQPDLVHFTGPHLWNLFLACDLSARGIAVVHTLHDLDAHSGTHYGLLLPVWNWLIMHSVDHVLVHGQRYRERLLAMGLPANRVTCTPLLHLFMAATASLQMPELADNVQYEPWALFFGRLKRYKGVECLLTACDMMDSVGREYPSVVMAGPGNTSKLWAGPLPKQLELRNCLVGDDEAIDLFRRCGLLVLPYLDATQSALIAAAYYFRKPVVVTSTGALPEYVEEGRTGVVVEPGHPATLARCLDDMLCDLGHLKRMGEAGREWYDQKRAAETQALFEMYRYLVNSKPITRSTTLQGSTSHTV